MKSIQDKVVQKVTYERYENIPEREWVAVSELQRFSFHRAILVEETAVLPFFYFQPKVTLN